MKIKEFMMYHLDYSCIDIQGLEIGLRSKDLEPFYYHQGNGPYVFGLAYDALQALISEEMDESYYLEQRTRHKE